MAILCVAALMLTACGEDKGKDANEPAETPTVSDGAEDGDGGGEPAATEKAEDAEDAAADAGEAAAIAGEEYDVGDFTVSVPDGWKAFPQTVVFGEPDEDGNYPIDSSSIYLSRDAETDADLISEPAVYIKYYDPGTELLSSKEWYDGVEDLDVSVQGREADEAYQGRSIISGEYDYQVLQFSLDGGQFIVNIPTSAGGEETGLSFDEPEVGHILESIAVSE